MRSFKKRLLASMMFLVMITGTITPMVYAEENNVKMCEHHQEHTEECGGISGDCKFLCELCKADENKIILDYTIEGVENNTIEFFWEGDSADKDNALSTEDIVKALPKTITVETNAEEEIEVEWDCEDFPAEKVEAGKYSFKAILPEGYVLAEDLAEITIEVKIAEEKETPREKSQSRAVAMVEIDVYGEYDGDVFANGIPILIKEVEAEPEYETHVYNADGSELPNGLSDIKINGFFVYGGSKSVTGTATGNTSITIESGYLSDVYGGDFYGERAGDTYVTMTGGSVRNLYGGSYEGNVDNTNVNITLEGDYAEILGSVFGGGAAGGAESSSVVVDGAKAGWVYGGSAESGVVKKTHVEVKSGEIKYYDEYSDDADVYGFCLGSIYGGGHNAPTGNTEVIVTGGSWGWAYGGGYNAEAENTSVTVSGGKHTILKEVDGKEVYELSGGNVYGGGNTSGASVKSTHISIYEGANPTMVSGGGYDGDVEGNVTIDVGNISPKSLEEDGTSRTWNTFVYGGSGGIGTVGGNTIINYDANNLLRGNNNIYVNGDNYTAETSGNKVSGSRTLNLKNIHSEQWPNQEILMIRLCKNLDMLTVENSLIQFFEESGSSGESYFPDSSMELKNRGTVYISQVNLNLKNDLILNGGSLVLQNGGTLTVGGSVDCKKIADLTITKKDSAQLTESKIKVMSGTNLRTSQFNLTNEGYTLVKEGEDIYAVKETTMAITISLDKENYQYGDTVVATVSVPMENGVTTNGEVTMRMDFNSVLNYEPEYTLPASQSKNIDASGKAVFSFPLDTGGNFKLVANFADGGAVGSSEIAVVAEKRKLTIKPSSVAGGSKDYDGYLTAPHVDFSNAVIEGYIRDDGGLEIDDDSIGDSYYFHTPDVGRKKETYSTHDIIYTKYFRNSILTAEQKKANKMWYRYIVMPPILTADINRKVVDRIDTNIYLSGKAGAPLSSIIMPTYTTGQMRWVDPNQKLTTAKTYSAVFVPNDIVNYDYSKIAGWDGQKVKLNLPVEILKGDSPANKTVTKNYSINSGEQSITIDLSGINPFANLDAGKLTYSYIGKTTADNIMDIVFDAGTRIFTFTLENVADPIEEMAILRVRVDSDNYNSAYIDTIISMVNKTPVEIEGVNVSSKSYDGRQAVAEGTAMVVGGYTGPLEYVWSSGEAPKDAGRYTLTVQVPKNNAEYVGSLVIDFNINRKEVIVRPADQTAKTGEDFPELELSYDTLVEGEAVAPTNIATVRYVDDAGNLVEDTNKAGRYRIIFDTIPSFDLRGNSEKNYTFNMSEGILTVEAKAQNPSGRPSHGGGGSHSLPQTSTTKRDEQFEQQPENLPSDNTANREEIGNPFVDIENHWAKEAILSAYRHGLFSGIDENNFGPQLSVTRGMMVAILFRLSGEESTSNESGFADVAVHMYYSPAIAWGNGNNIMSGFDNGLFRPDDEITREQLALLLYRYAQYMGRDVSNTGGLSMSVLNDYESISDWAQEAVQWCLNEGLISGRTDGSFDPKGRTTRAEAASVLMRFMNN